MIVVIDSTEYKQDRTFNNRNFAKIREYGKEGLITLHIPYMVYMEVYTTIVNELKIDLNQIKHNLLGLEKKGLSATDFVVAKSASKSIEDFISDLEESVAKSFEDFIDESKAINHPLYETDSKLVFDAYFSGNTPFKYLKNRDDIPDAFIFETIIRLTKEEDVHVVSGDANLRKSLESSPRIKTYNSLKGFLDSDELQEVVIKTASKLIVDQLVRETEIEDTKDLLIGFKDVIEIAVKKYTDSIHYLEIDEAPLPSDNGEATIQAIDADDIIIDREEIEYINDSYYMPILVKGIASVDFFVHKSDYWQYDNLSGSDWNKWVYHCEDSFPIELRKTTIIDKDEFNEDLEPEIEIDEFDEIKLITPFGRDSNPSVDTLDNIG